MLSRVLMLMMNIIILPRIITLLPEIVVELQQAGQEKRESQICITTPRNEMNGVKLFKMIIIIRLETTMKTQHSHHHSLLVTTIRITTEEMNNLSMVMATTAATMGSTPLLLPSDRSSLAPTPSHRIKETTATTCHPHDEAVSFKQLHLHPLDELESPPSQHHPQADERACAETVAQTSTTKIIILRSNSNNNKCQT